MCSCVWTPFMCCYFRPTDFQLHLNAVWKLLSFFLIKWFCAHVTEWVTEMRWISFWNKQRPGHIVCARLQTQEAVHMRLLLNILRSLDKQPVASRKQPIITPSNRSITSCRSVIQRTESPWLPCCQETVRVGRVDVSEMTATGWGNSGVRLVKARMLGAQKQRIPWSSALLPVSLPSCSL